MPALSPHQLPAYSPLSAGAILAALGSRAGHGRDDLEHARKLVAAEFRADDVVLVDSGRSALRLAITTALSGIDRPRIVALPAFQCFEVATAAVGADCEIVFYDIDPVSLRPDVESLERALRLGARAVVVAPLYGVPVNWDEVAGIADRHGAVTIEDAAQANGAEWRGHRLGSLGPMSVVSFGRGKGWTGGGGGALLLRGDRSPDHTGMRSQLAVAGPQRELRVAAVTILQLIFGRASLYAFPASIPSLGLGETRYNDPTPVGRCSGFSAALLRRTLGAARREADTRRAAADYWKRNLREELLAGVPEVLAGGTPGYLRFPLRVGEGAARASQETTRRAGVARSYPLPLNELPAVAAKLVQRGARFPGAESLVRELVTLPTHSKLTDRDRETIIALSTGWGPPG